MNRLFGNLLASLNAAASLGVLFLVALISTDVIGRAFFNAPLAGVPEIVKFSIVAMVWMWMAHALRTGAHLRTNLLLARMGPIGQRIVLIVNSAIGIALFAMITWLASIETMKSWEIGAFEGEDPMRVPVWPVWGILTFGAAMTSVQYALDTVRFIREAPAAREVSDVDTGH